LKLAMLQKTVLIKTNINYKILYMQLNEQISPPNFCEVFYGTSVESTAGRMHAERGEKLALGSAREMNGLRPRRQLAGVDPEGRRVAVAKESRRAVAAK
jgi:hypothetical protein